MSPTRPHYMANFGPLTAEIGLGVWAPSKFQRVSHLGFVTAATSLTGGQQTLHDVWPSPGLVHDIYIYIYTCSGGLAPDGILPGAKFTLRSSFAFHIVLAALLHGTPGEGVSKTLRCDARNGIIELLHRAARHLYSAGRPSRWTSNPHSS